MKLFSIKNLVSADVVRLDIEDDAPPPDTPMPFKSKDSYRKWCKSPDTNHRFVSFAEGENPHMRVGKDNPIRKLHGVVAEYDADNGPDWIGEIGRRVKKGFEPTWACRSFSPGRGRLFFAFEAPVTVGHDTAMVRFVEKFLQEAGAAGLALGFSMDESTGLARYYEIGRGWTRL